MAELFGFGTQKPRKLQPWEEKNRKEKELAPLQKLLMEQGREEEAAILNANIPANEKSIYARNAAIQAEKRQKEEAEKANKEEYLQGLYEKGRRVTEAAYKESEGNIFGNIREPIVAQSPLLAMLHQEGAAAAGVLSGMEGNKGTQSGKVLAMNAEHTGAGKFGSIIGTSPELVTEKILNPYKMKGEEERAAIEAGQAEARNNMNATPTPRGVVKSKSQLVEEKIGSYAVTPMDWIGDVMVDAGLSIANMATAAARTVFPDIGKVPELDTSDAQKSASNALVNAMGIAGAVMTGSAKGLGTVGKLATVGAGYVGSHLGSDIAGGLYNVVAGRPKTESQANRKEAVQEVGGMFGFGAGTKAGIKGAKAAPDLFSMANQKIFGAVNKDLSKARTDAANRATGQFGEKPTIDVYATKKEPTSAGAAQPKENINPAQQGMERSKSNLENIQKSAQASSIAVKPLSAEGNFSVADLKAVGSQVTEQSAVQALHVADLAKNIMAAHGQEGAIYAQTAKTIAKSVQSAVSNVEVKSRYLDQLLAEVDRVPASDMMLYEAKKSEEAIAKQALQDAIRNMASLSQAVSTQAQALSGMAVSNPETSYGSVNMKDVLNKAIETGSPMAEYMPVAIQVIGEAQNNPVAINKYRQSTPIEQQKINADRELWQREMKTKKEAADARYRAELQAQDKKTYEAASKSVAEKNKTIEAKNIKKIDDVLATALPAAEPYLSGADIAIRTAAELDKARKAAVKPLDKEFKAVKTALMKAEVPFESTTEMINSLGEAIEENKSLISSDVSTKLNKMLSDLRNKLINRPTVSLGELDKIIMEAGDIINFAKHEGHSVNKLQHLMTLVKEFFDKSSKALVAASTPAKSARLQRILDRRDAVRARYRAVKETYDNPEMARIRSKGGENKEPALKSLMSSPEGMSKMLMALGDNNKLYQTVLAETIRSELYPVAKLGDNQRKMKVIDNWSPEMVRAMPAGVETTLRDLSLDEPDILLPYRPHDYATASAPSTEWFKAPPKAVDAANMTTEQVWAMLDSVTGVERIRASTPDTPARQSLFDLKAEEILSATKLEASHPPLHFIGFLKKFGINKSIVESAVRPILSWGKALNDPAKAPKIQALLGDKRYVELRKEVKGAVRAAEQMVSSKQALTYTAASALPVAIALNPTIGLGVYTLFSLYHAARMSKASKKLSSKGFSTKRTSGGDRG